jgi:hypothetical protein
MNENIPEIPVTYDGRGFRLSREALRQAVDSGASTVRFTAPEGFRFGRDRRLHPDSEHDQEETDD